MPSTASLTWRPRISATLCAIILQAPVAVLPPPARGRLDRLAVLSEPGSTRARHEPAIGATAETRLVGQRQSLVRPYTPKTNGKAERFIQTSLREWAYAQAYENSRQRKDQLPIWLHQYNWHRPHRAIDDKTPISRLGLTGNNVLRFHS